MQQKRHKRLASVCRGIFGIEAIQAMEFAFASRRFLDGVAESAIRQCLPVHEVHIPPKPAQRPKEILEFFSALVHDTS